jgi:hypothetical protein
MRIERFDPEADPARTRACYQAYRASALVDDPLCPPTSLRAFTSLLACGWTEDHPEVWFAGDSPDRAEGCTRPHRGHRLGLLLKVAMLDLLAEREPQLRWVVTANADSNSHMIAINAALGFRFLDSRSSWQLDVQDVLALPRPAGNARPASRRPPGRSVVETQAGQPQTSRPVSRRNPGGAAAWGRAASPWPP